jgi:hypothetical protein
MELFKFVHVEPSKGRGNMSDNDLLHRIERYIEGKLPEEEVEPLWDELIDKPAYREYLETLNNLKKTRRATGPADSSQD